MVVMDKKAVISKFLESGKQLDAPSIDFFVSNPDKIDVFLSKSSTHPMFITKDIIDSSFGCSSIEIMKKFPIKTENEKLSISDCSNRSTGYYGKIRDILAEKVDSSKLMSINKSSGVSQFIIIASIREIDGVDKTALVEDMTGSATVSLNRCDDFHELRETDIVALECVSSGDGIEVSKIVWPDIPFSKTVEKSDGDSFAIFLSDLHMDSDRFDKKMYSSLIKSVETATKSHKKSYIFILGGISSNKNDIESFLGGLPQDSKKVIVRSTKDFPFDPKEGVFVFDGPVLVKVDGVTMLLCQGDSFYKYKGVFGEEGTDVIKNLLKRRDLAPNVGNSNFNIRFESNIVSPVPSIFASGGFHKCGTSNYKGTTIITTGSLDSDSSFITADLRTREINKVVMS